MTKGAFGVMMIVMMNVARLSGAQYSVELEPDTAKRKVIAIGYGARTAELSLHPEVPWRIGSSRIDAQDDVLWSGPYGSYGTSDPTPCLHRYLMLNAHSSREYVKITGVLTQDGAGGTPPWFRATVPAVDIDWAGYESAAQENDEDTRKLFCPVTNDVSKCRKLVIRNPLDSGKLRDDPSLLGSSPDMLLTLASGYADCFRLRKANGTVFNTGSFNINNIPSWPLELYVEALPNRPPSNLEITLEGPAGPDGARTLDRIIGTTVVKVDSETVATTPADRTRKTIGIAEEVVCTLNPPLSATWSLVGGGSIVSAPDGTSASFTAPETPCTPVVHAQVGGADCEVSFNVIAPTGMNYHQDNQWCLGFPRKPSPPAIMIGVGRKFPVTILPTTVSFYNAEFRENKTGQAYTWPDGTADMSSIGQPEFSVNQANMAQDQISSGLDGYWRLKDGDNYVAFSYNAPVPLEYWNGASWVEFMSGTENHHEHLYQESGSAAAKAIGSTVKQSLYYGPWIE